MSAERMTLHDKRLLGNPPAISQNTFQVDDTWKITNAFNWVSAYAKAKNGLDVLYIMCHGYYGNDDNKNLKTCGTYGGYGLALCAEGLTMSNVEAIGKMIDGLVDNIVIFACGAASDRGSIVDGKYFCARLAINSKATVYAADRKQVYTFYPGSATLPLDFGGWEGTVYRATPDGTVTPIEMNSSPNPT